ncbi:MAG TPA: DUF2339 domain-containing protein [Gaiellaceae bacterium]|jgi:uncharacterized membrane protein|nr:DUF2339 domain-containing protein [Gaiellaceae bacterium]
MTELMDRLNSFEHRLRDMETELYELRRLARKEEEPAPELEAPLWETLEPPPAAPEPERGPTPVPIWTPPPRKQREPLDLSVLLGARALAWTGGIVTLLGIVFFFVLAVERGWIGPVARVTLGATVSGGLVLAALWLRRRFGDTYASLSAAGVGIAGFYATLLAATALYDLVPAAAAVVAAGGIAAVGAGIAWRWNSETLASLGLLGAILAPVAIAIQSDLTPLGVAFAGLVLTAATVVAVLRGWRGLHVAAVVAAAPQAIALMFDNPSNTVPVVFGICAVLAVVPVWLALRTRLTYLPATLLMFSAAYGGWAAGVLFGGNTQGCALLGVALAYGAAGTALYRRDRDVASLLWALGLTLAAVGAASLASGATLTIVWSAEAAILAWLARRIKEPRFQVAAFAWFGLAFVHGIAIDAPLTKLFVENTGAWRSVSSAASLAIAAGLVGLCGFKWNEREEGIFARVFAELLALQPWVRRGGLVVAGVTALYAGSLAVVGLPAAWGWGHVLVAALWSAVAVLLVGTRQRVWSLGAIGASVILVLAYDLPQISESQRSWAFAVVGAAAFVVAVVWEQSFGETLELPAVATLVASVGLAAASTAELLAGDARAWVFLALAAGYGLTGIALLRRRRDFAAALGIAALALAFPASVWLLDETWLVLAWAATGAALAVLARYEDRLQYGALAYLAFALVHTLVMEAQPNDVFVTQDHPGSGLPAVLLVLAGLLAFTYVREAFRTPLLWACGALGVFAATLAILEASERAGGSVSTAFQRGHTAVSAVWAIVGLALLILGLKRSRMLQVGGLALFGISLAKLFLYDLSFLSSVTRAFSFVAVGMLNMVGGFFYQRMAALESRS